MSYEFNVSLWVTREMGENFSVFVIYHTNIGREHLKSTLTRTNIKRISLNIINLFVLPFQLNHCFRFVITETHARSSRSQMFFKIGVL